MRDKPDTAAKADDLTKLKRGELDKVAEKAGVPNPDDLPNKDAVVEAIEGPNPALAPVPEAADGGEKSYEVTGPLPVRGHKTGTKFTAAIPTEQEALLIESGHIKRSNLED